MKERRMEKWGGREGEEAFTLMELIMTVALMGLVITQIYSLLHTTVQAGQQIEEIILGSNVAPSVVNVISSDVKGAISYSSAKPCFTGAQSELSFITANSFFTFEGGKGRVITPVEVSYYLKDNPADSNYKMLYRRVDTTLDSDVKSGGIASVVYDKVRLLEIDYIEYADGTKSEASVWDSEKKAGKLPSAINVRITIGLYKRKGEKEDRERTIEFKVVVR